MTNKSISTLYKDNIILKYKIVFSTVLLLKKFPKNLTLIPATVLFVRICTVRKIYDLLHDRYI